MRLEEEDFDTEQGWREYLSLRRVWNRLDSPTPGKNSRTWRTWFKDMFGREATEAADEYVAMGKRKPSEEG